MKGSCIKYSVSNAFNIVLLVFMFSCQVFFDLLNLLLLFLKIWIQYATFSLSFFYFLVQPFYICVNICLLLDLLFLCFIIFQQFHQIVRLLFRLNDLPPQFISHYLLFLQDPLQLPNPTLSKIILLDKGFLRLQFLLFVNLILVMFNLLIGILQLLLNNIPLDLR